MDGYKKVSPHITQLHHRFEIWATPTPLEWNWHRTAAGCVHNARGATGEGLFSRHEDPKGYTSLYLELLQNMISATIPTEKPKQKLKENTKL